MSSVVDLDLAVRHTCSCGAPMVWARWKRSREKVPLDPDPVVDGNVVIVAVIAGEPQVELVSHLDPPSLLDDPNMPEPARFVTHFTTCPQAKEHRKR